MDPFLDSIAISNWIKPQQSTVVLYGMERSLRGMSEGQGATKKRTTAMVARDLQEREGKTGLITSTFYLSSTDTYVSDQNVQLAEGP